MANPRVITVGSAAYPRSPYGIAAASSKLHNLGGNGAVHVPPGEPIEWDTTQVVVTLDGITISSCPGTRVQIKLPSTDQAVVPFIFRGVGGVNMMSLTANASMYDRRIPSTGLVQDDLVLVSDTFPNWQVCRIQDGTGGISDQLCEDFSPFRDAVVQKLTMLRRCRLEGFDFDANGNTGQGSMGAQFYFTNQCEAGDCTFTGFGGGDTQGGFLSCYGYMNTWRDMDFVKSGTHNFNDFGSWHESRTLVDNIKSDQSPGFGPGFLAVHYCTARAVSVAHAQGRGIKYAYSSFNHVTDPIVLATEPQLTGLSLVQYSHHNIVSGGLGLGDSNGDLFISGSHNLVTGGYFQSVYIDGAPQPEGNRIYCKYDRLIDQGVGTKT